MVLPRRIVTGAKRMDTSRPFPANRPDLEIKGFTLTAEQLEDEIYLVPDYADKLLPEDVVRVNGQETLSAERSLLDLANCTRGEDLWRMLDNSMAQGLTTPARLRRAIERHPRHQGGRRLSLFLAEWSRYGTSAT
jgi:hypothetical protein